MSQFPIKYYTYRIYIWPSINIACSRSTLDVAYTVVEKSWHSVTQNSNIIGLRASHKTHTQIQWDPPTASENLHHRPSRSSTPLVEISCLCRRAATRNDDNRQQWHPALPSLSPRLMASPAGLLTPCPLFSLRLFVSISSSMHTLIFGGGEKLRYRGIALGGQGVRRLTGL